MSNPVIMVRIWSEKLQERFDILYFSCLKCQTETFKTPVKYRINVGQEFYYISQKSCQSFRGISSRYFVMSLPQTCEERAVGKTFSEINLEIEHLPWRRVSIFAELLWCIESFFAWWFVIYLLNSLDLFGFQSIWWSSKFGFKEPRKKTDRKFRYNRF